MTFVSCSIAERFVNPLFEVFDGGDFILSSYRDIEEDFTRLRIFIDPALGPVIKQVEDAKTALASALAIVGAKADLEVGELADEDWKLAYRRHFKIERIGKRLMTVPAWEKVPAEEGRLAIVLDPGMAFGTGKHETTRACLEYLDELAANFQPSAPKPRPSLLDMGTGSGILAIAAVKLGFEPVAAFDVDAEAVTAAGENARANGVGFDLFRYGLGAKVRRALPQSEVVVANILGPLLIRFAEEIVPTVGKQLIISGILTELYPEVRSAFEKLGLKEVSHKFIGEWATGLLVRDLAVKGV